MKESVEEKKYAPVGVFDSGVGGLTVAREIMRQLPKESIIYFGDTARVPYGSKSKETIIRYSRQIIHFLESMGVKAIVVACNTASAFALEELRPEMKMPIIGVVKPGAKVAAETTQNGRDGREPDLYGNDTQAPSKCPDSWKSLPLVCALGGGRVGKGFCDNGSGQAVPCIFSGVGY